LGRGFYQWDELDRCDDPPHGKKLMALSVEDQKQVIRSYCNEHPLPPYWEAVIDLYNKLPNSDFHFPENQFWGDQKNK
jgi:hypothetical protein